MGNVGVADTWNIRTTVLLGAAHFAIAGKNVWRSLAAANGALISACDVGNDMTVDANWGDDFPVGPQDREITALVGLFRFLLVITQDNLWGATEDFDAALAAQGAVSFAEMLPDIKFSDDSIDGVAVAGAGASAWNASVLVPTFHNLYQHFISDYERVGPDRFPNNSGLVPQLTEQLRRGVHRGTAVIDDWVYTAYQLGSDVYILAGRSRDAATPGSEPIVWHTIAFHSGQKCFGLHIQRTGVNAPTLWYGGGVTGAEQLNHIRLAQDGSPYKAGEPYGLNSQDPGGTWFGKEFDLGAPGTPKLLREIETVIDDSATDLTFQHRVSRDGATEEDAGGEISASSTIFFAANVTARRVFPSVDWITLINYASTGNKTFIRSIIYRGSWLPNVADVITTMIDIGATARRRGVSLRRVREDLKALVLSGSYGFIDLHGSASVQATVDQGSFSEGGEIAAIEGKEIAQMVMSVQESA